MISLSKTFELELNLSIVQWIRSFLKIEMPQYFNAHKESVNDYSITPSPAIVPNPTPVDFNKGYGNKWFPPGIGQSELVAKTLFQQGIFPAAFISDANGFLSVWKTMRLFRNKATHIKPIDQAQFTQVETGFNTLKVEYLRGLVDLKHSLKN
ncbi:MAG: hypothetical protein IPK08_19730 [Bacteroidetes bacterium]|nr:hypothetical protein [Bacteroidota bacterium]